MLTIRLIRVGKKNAPSFRVVLTEKTAAAKSGSFLEILGHYNPRLVEKKDGKTGKKIKQLYSCNIVDFAEVAGGHNFRDKRETRLKYRYYHQHRGFAEAYEEAKCVGCGRCSRVCLAGINPPDVISDLQAEVRV